jgi:hypothetical protein
MLAMFFSGLSWTRIGIAISVLVGVYATGYVRGEINGSAGALRQQIAALEQAAADKDKLQQADATRAAQAELDRAALEIRLKQVLNANPDDASCRLPISSLNGMCQLANSSSGDCAPVPGASIRPQKRVREKP